MERRRTKPDPPDTEPSAGVVRDQLLRELVAREIKAMDVYLDRSAVKANADFLLKYELISAPFDTSNFVYQNVPGAPASTK